MAKRRPPPSPVHDPVFFRLFEKEIRKGDLRKLEIVKATLKVLTEQGIHATTYEAIAIELGIKRPQVAYYFSSLQELFVLTFRYLIDTVQNFTILEIQKARTPHERLMAVFSGIFRWANESPAHPRGLALLQHLAGCDPEFCKLHTEIREIGQRRLGTLIISYRSEWDKHPDELASVCRLLQGAALGSVLAMGATQNVKSTLASLSEIQSLVQTLIEKDFENK